MLDPVVLLALAVLIVNDRVAKAAWPGPLTGKLSDVAGLIVAPIALQAAWELMEWAAGRWSRPSGQVLAASIGVVAIAFALAQVWVPAIDAYRWGLGLLQWPLRAAAALVSGGALPGVQPVVAGFDPGDLLVLPAIVVTWWVGRRRLRRQDPPADPAHPG